MKIGKYGEIDLDAKIETWEKWWQGSLGRPLFCAQVALEEYEWPRRFPCYDAGTSVEQIVAIHKNALAATGYMADGYPRMSIDFGPGCLAPMVGGSGNSEGTDTVWFGPGKFKGKPLEEFSLAFDENSEWCRRISDAMRTASQMFGDYAIVGMTDIGGVFDVLASLRDSQTLLTDLYDNPDEVKRLLAEESRAFLDCYAYFDAQLQTTQNARTCWASILSRDTNYMLQSDFSYMISPDMFAEFVAPELAKQCAALAHPCYHLDGVGQLPHIQHLVKIPNLQCIQWIPGDGVPEQDGWPDVLRQIEDGGMKLQLFGSCDAIEKSLRLLKNPENAHVLLWPRRDDLPRVERLLSEYGAC